MWEGINVARKLASRQHNVVVLAWNTRGTNNSPLQSTAFPSRGYCGAKVALCRKRHEKHVGKRLSCRYYYVETIFAIYQRQYQDNPACNPVKGGIKALTLKIPRMNHNFHATSYTVVKPNRETRHNPSTQGVTDLSKANPRHHHSTDHRPLCTLLHRARALNKTKARRLEEEHGSGTGDGSERHGSGHGRDVSAGGSTTTSGGGDAG